MSTLRFPSTNPFDIPDLVLGDVSLLPPPVPSPTVTWGAVSRRSAMIGLWLFYVDDYRFAGLWRDPDGLLRTCAVAAAEPNFTIADDTSRAEALWQLYRKRWLSRYWQQHRISVWVDLHVAPAHADIALLGVPRGWQRWATCGMGRAPEQLDSELAMAVERSNGNPYTLIVYGGGPDVGEWCRSRANIVHVHHRTRGATKPGMRTRAKARLAP